MPSLAQLNTAVNSLEADSSIHAGNLTEAGLWLRFALAAEELAGASSSANASVSGYMLRSAVALESISGTSGAEENANYRGFLKRIVDALEVQAGAVTVGSLEGRLVVAAAAATYGPPVAPANTVPPVVSGTATEGETLSTTNGTWTGSPSPTFTYQWQDDGVNIGGATASTFPLTATQVGGAVRCVVTGTNIAGSASANSNATAAVAALGGAITAPVLSNSVTNPNVPGDTTPRYTIDFVDAYPTGGGVGDNLEGRWGTSEAAAIALTPVSVAVSESWWVDGVDPFPTLTTFSEAQSVGTTVHWQVRVERSGSYSAWSNFETLALVDGTMNAPAVADLTGQTVSSRVWSSQFAVAGLGAGAFARLTATGPMRLNGTTVTEAGNELQVQNGALLEFGVDTSGLSGTATDNVVSNRGVALETFTATTAGAGAPAATLTAEYLLDEGTGQTFADNTGNALTGTVGNTTGVDAGEPTWATTPTRLNFAGAQGAKVAANALLESTSLAIVAVVRASAFTGDDRCIAAQDDATPSNRRFSFRFSATGLLNAFYRTAAAAVIGPATAASATPLTTWVMVTMWINGTALKVRQAGVEVASVTGGAVMATGATQPLAIGSRTSNSSPIEDIFRGDIAYVSLRAGAATLVEVQEMEARATHFATQKGITL